MSHRTVILSSFDDYLANECSRESGVEEKKARDRRRSRFPHAVMLQAAYPEIDFADRWCWQHIGPADGACMQRHSEYPACSFSGAHSHAGKWMSHFFGKTDYDFGYNEWYFEYPLDHQRFLASVGEINWGENYPK